MPQKVVMTRVNCPSSQSMESMVCMDVFNAHGHVIRTYLCALCMCLVTTEAGRGQGTSGTDIKDCDELPWGAHELNPGPLEGASEADRMEPTLSASLFLTVAISSEVITFLIAVIKHLGGISLTGRL